MNYFNFINYASTYKRLIINLLLSLLLVYFVFHSFYGNRGIIAYFTLNQKLQKSYSELEDLRAERVELEHKVKLLRPESLDKDMLDQEARRVLGVASPNEKVFTDSSLKE
jgi:cell division protein FtsB